MIEINDLSKRFGKQQVLEHISLNIEEGQCTALIGKNGAGKSTLINIIIGHSALDTGTISDPEQLINNQSMGILFQRTQFPKLMKVKDLFNLYQSLYKNPMSKQRFLEITQFSARQMNQMATALSGGQQRILDFALTLIGNPQLIILDEPTSAMDIETREHFWSIIRALKKENKTILYTSHYIEEVERMADHIVLLDKGKIQMDDTLESMKEKERLSILYLPKKYEEVTEKLSEGCKVIQDDSITKVQTTNVNEVLPVLVQYDVDLNEIEVRKTSLLEMMFQDSNEEEVTSS
ncbi:MULTISPECIES: ABC transporter ATP-binding protein [Staphylococcus]|uniref:ABC transporter ATP-binding protein n=1 Tax=Staphylococcus hsinchuensis TaxID=3051183 RepID=A0ABZ3EE35_9STAP|nr:ABC transporter ATP-binding protein [Staphylococcus sp. Marseille-Q6910]